MTKTKEVKTSVGVWVLKKPKAGVRNKAMKMAESDSGVFKKTVLMGELLPACVQQRPDGYDKDVPINQQLDDLEIEDYDLLVVELTKLITSPIDEVAKVDEANDKKKESLTDSSKKEDSPKLENTE